MSKWYLNIVVFIAGAAVLAIEILGTRILGPFYGVSLFLWSALITVTLVALSVGYAIGGRWADKGPMPSRLYYLLAGAGIWVLLIPWLRAPILVVAEPFGLRFAVLVAAFILFFPPLTLLGMVSPYAIRVRASSLSVVGRTAGDLYAISTVGSVAAALLTGFILIPSIGVSRLTLMTGSLLLMTAFFGLALSLPTLARQVTALMVALVAITAIWALPSHGLERDPGTIAIEQSPYAEIRVLETADGQTRLLVIDGGVHTVVDPASWESHFPYVALIRVAECLVEQPGRLLLIGVGGGSVIKEFAADGWQVDAVEVDPVVVAMAEAHFGLRPDEATIHIMDGRQFLTRQAGTYDLIVMDAFGSSSIPFHLATEEAFGLIASRLVDDGLFVVNLESRGWHSPTVQAIGATLQRHFEQVVALPADPEPDALGNVVLFAANRPLAFRPTVDGPGDIGPECPYRTNRYANRGWNDRFTPDTAGAHVLTDDLNHVDLWSEATNLIARRDLHRYFAERELSSY